MKAIGSIAVVMLLCGMAPAQKLEVKSATASKVELAWTGTASQWIVERKSGAAFEKVSESTSTSYQDTSIAPFGTYTYRVRSGSAATPSNEVIVGPPPMGLLKPAPAPKGDNRDSDDYGRKTALALDENGDAAFAFLWRDPNANNQPEESQVMFVRWNRAQYKWDEPRKLAVTGATNVDQGEPLSLAFQPGTGIAGLVYPVKDQEGFTFALSKDGGNTWQMTPYSNGLGGPVDSSVLSFVKDHFYLAVNAYQDGPALIDGDIGSDAGTWRVRKPPVLGREHHNQAPAGLAVDAQGLPYMAYFDTPAEGSDSYLFNVWQPDSGKAVTAANTHDDRPDSPILKLADGGGRFALLMTMHADDKDDQAGVWATTSTDGTTWTPAVKIPHDKSRSSGDTMSIAVDTKGAIFAVFSTPSGSEDGVCGNADFATSTDGVTWTHCGVGKFASDAFTPDSASRSVVTAPDDSIYYLWNESRSTKYGPGLVIWHRR
ncbi:MAG: hypothetical protein WBF42_12700 [Terracidiphilus sp.]